MCKGLSALGAQSHARGHGIFRDFKRRPLQPPVIKRSSDPTRPAYFITSITITARVCSARRCVDAVVVGQTVLYGYRSA